MNSLKKVLIISIAIFSIAQLIFNFGEIRPIFFGERTYVMDTYWRYFAFCSALILISYSLYKEVVFFEFLFCIIFLGLFIDILIIGPDLPFALLWHFLILVVYLGLILCGRWGKRDKGGRFI